VQNANTAPRAPLALTVTILYIYIFNKKHYDMRKCMPCGPNELYCNWKHDEIIQCKPNFAIIDKVCVNVSALYKFRDKSTCMTFKNSTQCETCFKDYLLVDGIC